MAYGRLDLLHTVLPSLGTLYYHSNPLTYLSSLAVQPLYLLVLLV